MGLPAITDVARDYLFADAGKMVAAGVPAATQRHLLRLRDMYSYWLAQPSRRDRDIVAALRQRYGISETAAREDLRLIKTLLGDLQTVSQKYMRYRVSQMLEQAYERAERAGNTRDMIAAAKSLGQVHRLDQDDEQATILDKVVPMVLDFTDDPTVIGIPRMPNHRARIDSMKQKYYDEATEDVGYEELDMPRFGSPSLQPTPGHGNTDAEGIPQ